MAPSLLSLPLELLSMIYHLVLLDSSTPHLRICKPNDRFAYEDLQHSIENRRARLVCYEPRTRQDVQASLPQRPRDHHRSRTRISLLLVCKIIYDGAAGVYYGGHDWEIGVHGRNPPIPVFREFLDAIGARNGRWIRSVVILSRLGYDHLWTGLPDCWARQLQRCENLRSVLISMSNTWFEALDSRREFWEEACLLRWQQKFPLLERIDIWDQESSTKGLGSPIQEYVDTLLRKVGIVPEGLHLRGERGL